MAGTNFHQNIKNMGSLQSTSSAVAGHTAQMICTVAFKTGDSTSFITEYLWRTTVTPAGNCVLNMGAGTTWGVTPQNNSFGIGYNITGAAEGWAFYSVNNAGVVEKDIGLIAPINNVFHSVTFVIAATSISCFINGVQYGTTHVTSIPSTSAAIYLSWYIGNGADAVDYKQEIKQVRVMETF